MSFYGIIPFFTKVNLFRRQTPTFEEVLPVRRSCPFNSLNQMSKTHCPAGQRVGEMLTRHSSSIIADCQYINFHPTP